MYAQFIPWYSKEKGGLNFFQTIHQRTLDTGHRHYNYVHKIGQYSPLKHQGGQNTQCYQGRWEEKYQLTVNTRT